MAGLTTRKLKCKQCTSTVVAHYPKGDKPPTLAACPACTEMVPAK